MYSRYFGFAEAPFSIAPDPRYLYLSEEHREALAHLVYGIGDHGGFVVLTGEVGTGKTTVCRCLLQQIPQHVDVAVVVNPKLSAHELLQTVCEELGVALPEGALSNKQLIDQLNGFLLSTHARGRNAILIIDEAQNLTADVLEQLRLLTNLETNERKLLQLILLGQPELNDLLAQPQLRQLAQRITARHHLSPLSLPEVERYISHRLAVAGAHRDLFTASAIKRIYNYSGGIPRLINVLCDRALLGVYATQSSVVDTAMVKRAVREIAPPRSSFLTSMRRLGLQRHGWALAIASLVIAAAATLLWRDGDTTDDVALARQAHPAWMQSLRQSPRDDNAIIAALYAAWNVDAPGTLCPSNDGEIGCVSVRDFDRQALERAPLPAVLVLADEGWQRMVLLEQLDGATARVRFSGRDWEIAWDEVARYWHGDTRLLIPAPVAGLPLRPGATGPLVAWVDSQLYRHFKGSAVRWQERADDYSARLTYGAGRAAWLNSHFLALQPAAPASVYSAELESMVKQFQAAQGLSTDGVVTLETVLLLARGITPEPSPSEEREG